ncbi:MAG: class I SAM-dependent methyltransferase [Chloroflexota bacterium]
MDEETARYLNTINQRFYETVADDFDATRQQAWPGWLQLLPHIKRIPHKAPLRVLDVGCGNARFALFLADQLGVVLAYHGVDSNDALLATARSMLGAAGIDARLQQQDVIFEPLPPGQYDLVVAFGLLHHVPGMARRRKFVRSLAAHVAEGGLLGFTCWRFYEFDRFRSRIVPWDDTLADRVERHDYLLDWRRGERALRYCHYVDRHEQAELVEASGLSLTTAYDADGFSGDLNSYIVVGKA